MLKNRNFLLLWAIFALLFGALFLTSSCKEDDEDDDPIDTHDELYVKYQNDQRSTVNIVGMQLRPHGRADEQTGPTGSWTDDIIPGEDLAPGESVYFTVKIPNLDRWEYRLTIKTPEGQTIKMWEQEGWNDQSYYYITHWGGDKRFVYTYILKDENTGRYYISGWGDNADDNIK